MPQRHTLFPDVEVEGHFVDPIVMTIDETAGGPVTEPSGDHPLGHHGYIGTSLSSRKLAVSFGVFFLGLLALTARAGYLDLRKGDEYRSLAEGNRLRIVATPAERGVIHDRNGVLLVRNVPDFTLTVTPADLPKDEKERADLVVRIAESVGVTPVDVEKALRNYPSNLASAVPIKEHLEYEQAVRLDIASGHMPGVSLKTGSKREILLQPEGIKTPIMSLSHVIGYQGRVNESEYARLKDSGYLPTDAIGKTGVEASYETQLRGTYGRKQIEVDALGREQKILASDDPIQGMDVTLAIDAKLQAEAERSLKASAGLNGRGRASAVAMNPKTGEILALVSLPSYDANLFARGISSKEYKDLLEDPNQPLYPRAVSGLFPPGSTAKLMVAAAALAEKVITTSTTVRSTGGIRYGAWFFPDWKPGGHGVTNVTKAIAESVNSFFYAIGGGYEQIEGLGIARLGAYYRKFGIGEKLGIDLPGEGKGFVPDEAWKARVKDEPWYIGDTYHVSIGQGDLLTTPLQVAAWTAVFANGGDLVTPHVVKQVRSTKTIERIEPPPVARQVVPKEVVDIVRRGMRETVLSGSARSLQSSPWPMAGKTGTAQWRIGEPTHAWFTGFAPYDDPQIVVTVLIEAGGEGSHSATPVARDIMEAWLRPRDAAAPAAKPAVKPVDAATSTAL
ncbi:MAG TPA: penicillin-binding protein 2 [Candidatus Baltobacteraceae bacterium]|nr:penicillin-binding protein 2 [Candidatus Baltobacteraceae bacterium]